MTTHFSNGVTNVIGKSGGTSLFSGIIYIADFSRVQEILTEIYDFSDVAFI